MIRSMLRDLDWLDVALHVPLALAVYFAFQASPGLGAALFLWIREAAQRNPGDFIEGMKLWKYSTQKHAEIWLPALAVEAVTHIPLPVGHWFN
jgi:hypothetical protein